MMLPLSEEIFRVLSLLLEDPFSLRTWELFFSFVPFVFFLELPVYLMVLLGTLRWALTRMNEAPFRSGYFPSVSCIVTCYSEGEAVRATIRSLAEQLYPGRIQILPVVDGASRNAATYEAARSMIGTVRALPRRSIEVIPKWQRGGRVSALNTALNFADGEIVMALDGDTSFDNDMVERATRHFADPDTAAVSGCLRVRNAKENLVTRMQAIEYFLSIQASKTGLSAWGIVNNISGAFGIFRKSVLRLILGWDTGTAEDLDITLRIKNYLGRYGRRFTIVFDPEAMGFTDVPDSLGGYLRQRLRWDGDLSYLYFRKHALSFSPRLVGWRNFLSMLWTGLLFQIVMPLLILGYTAWLLFALPAQAALSILGVIYLFYLAITTVFFLTFTALLSERPRQDMTLFPFLPLMPFFTFLSRLNNAYATLWELFGRSHEDTSMAPWWVTRKSRF
jgi:cellulose synthase/poly-beta-1,6-N-acetylglucosamine synthase-like glycosyltransferase